MSQRISPTNKEVLLGQNELIISKTDLSGKITYANKVFMKICDFSEEQLLGQNHNIIRHPDMPKGAFYGLWQTLKQGKEFFAVVKNLTANGDYYWVLANIRPDRVDANSIGYFSVRRAPSRSLIEQVKPIYAEMIELERHRGQDAAQYSWQWLEKKLAAQQTTYAHFILDLAAQSK